MFGRVTELELKRERYAGKEVACLVWRNSGEEIIDMEICRQYSAIQVHWNTTKWKPVDRGKLDKGKN